MAQPLPEPLRNQLAGMGDRQVLELAARVAAFHSRLRGRGRVKHLESLLASQVVAADLVSDAQPGAEEIVAEAVAAIWCQPMLEPREIACQLGAKPTNREKARALRQKSVLLGLPQGGKYVYPAFQLDPSKRQVFPEVVEINRILNAAEDPWGAASWWVSANDRLGDRPLSLVGTSRRDELIAAARSLVEAA